MNSNDISPLLGFLQAYHDEVMGYERQAVMALEENDKETYLSLMRKKAEKMSLIFKNAVPFLKPLPAPVKIPISQQLQDFSASASMGLRIGSPFYWSALLWDDDAKPGDPDNLQRFISRIENDELNNW